MKKDYKGLTLLCLSAAMSLCINAAPDSKDVAFGTVRGRIVDTENHVLPGATVMIENLKTGVVSDINGYYTVHNLAPGTYTVKVSYVGYAPKTAVMTVAPDKTAVLDFVLTEGLELSGVEVKGPFSGQSRAINMQKNNFNLTNVVSADQIGKFPDSNIGDALKRINGINVQYDQGEARFGQVRGTSPDLSTVTVNGNRMPSAEGDIRNVQLDLIPADMIQTIEVNKVVTSDMDGDAIGGSINLVTKNTPYKRTLNLTAGSGYNWISDKMQLNLGATWGDRFFKDRFGIMAAVSYQNSPAGSDNTEFTYDIDDSDNVVLSDAEVRQYYVTRERQSYSLAMDYMFNPNHKILFSGIYNRRNDWENRYRLTYKDIAEGAGKMQARIQTKGGSDDNRNARLELQQTMDFTLSGEHQLFNRLKADWAASYSRASEDRPDERYFDLQQKKMTFNMLEVGGRQPWSDTYVNLDEGKWSLKEFTNSDEDIDEDEWKMKLNFELPLASGAYGNKIKFGGKYTYKTKTKEVVSFDYADGYDEVYGKEYMDHLTSQIRDGFMPGSRYKSTLFVDKHYMGGFTADDFAKMNGTQVLEESSGNYDATEKVAAAYLRFEQRLGSKLNLMLGLRMENTSLKNSGFNWIIDENEEESLVPTGNYKNHYTNWLPSVLLKYDVTDEFKLRASYTKTLARPKYSHLSPGTTINRSESPVEISLGNPELKPVISNNYDISAEYYFKSVGLVSASLFYKRINDYMVEHVTRGSWQNYDDCKITKPVNAFDADLFGVEIGWQRDFGFISPALKCLGFYGNYTYTHSNVVNSVFGDKDEQTLPGSPEHMANASLYFDKWGLNVRLSYNFTSAFQDDEEYQEDSRLRRYYDKVNYLDLNAGYTWGKDIKYTVYAAANNLLNQPLRYYQGEKDRTMQVEYYGVKVQAGFKVNF